MKTQDIREMKQHGIREDIVHILPSGEIVCEDMEDCPIGTLSIVTDHETSDSYKTTIYDLSVMKLTDDGWNDVGYPYSTMFWRKCKTDGRYNYHRSKAKIIDKIIDWWNGTRIEEPA